MDSGKDPPHGPGSLPPNCWRLRRPLNCRQRLRTCSIARRIRGRIVTCPKSCRRPVLAQPPNSSGPKNNEAGLPADYVFRAARPRSARVRVPIKLPARPRSPCLRTPWPPETAPEPRSPALMDSSFARDFSCCRVAGRGRAESPTNLGAYFGVVARFFALSTPTFRR